MPTAQTGQGWRRSRQRRFAAIQAKPTSAPIAKVMAASWNGGTAPLAAVKRASSDHIRMAEKPISVARLPLAGGGAGSGRAAPAIVGLVMEACFIVPRPGRPEVIKEPSRCRRPENSLVRGSGAPEERLANLKVAPPGAP